QLTLQLPAALLPAQGLIFNTGGQLVQQFTARNERQQADVRSLAAGQYYLQLQTKEGGMTMSFLKE
ncbi:MAG: T9SS type A sorting domain-containing protein, partial [Phaeodactylibacter sp.]|nr:T9SS type A sorting domain-containing protein [Phaeodactylibacter sp.]